jgi:hypothetical protein
MAATENTGRHLHKPLSRKPLSEEERQRLIDEANARGDYLTWKKLQPRKWWHIF